MTIERSNDFESTAGADQDLRDLFHRTSQRARTTQHRSVKHWWNAAG